MTWQYSCAVGHHSHRCGRCLIFMMQRKIIFLAIVFSSCLQELAQINIFNDLKIQKNWPIFFAVRHIYALFEPYEAILRS